MAFRVVVGAVALVLGTASLAHAGDPAQLQVYNLQNGGLVVSCEPLEECFVGQGACDGGGVCSALGSLNVCLPSIATIVPPVMCCDEVSDCPARDGASAVSCVHVVGDVNVCVYGGNVRRLLSLCANTPSGISLDRVAACFGADNAGSTGISLATGDCDGDGVQNQSDPTPCAIPIIEPPDAGVPFDDLGVVNPDGAVVVPPFDLGNPPRVDAGPSLDSGARPSSPTSPSFRGAGGCAAGGANPSLPSGTGATALLLVLGVALRRRTRAA